MEIKINDKIEYKVGSQVFKGRVLAIETHCLEVTFKGMPIYIHPNQVIKVLEYEQ